MSTIFWTILAVHILYVLPLGWGWRRGGDTASSGNEPPVSVVVAARNEAKHLPSLLDAVDAQQHSNYEVVIVDDASSDGTSRIVADWVAERPHASLLSINDPTPPRKKNALTKGIQAAQHDLLAFTDADCSPPPQWLSILAATHAHDPDPLVLVGHSPPQASGLLGTFSRYETLLESLYSVASIGLDRAYMAVGRNLSYPRSVFEEVGGFAPSANRMSGDDDLFVQAVYRQDAARVRALLDERTFVPTDGPSSWWDWIQQRRRHVSAGRSYPWSVGVHLTLLQTSFLGLWLAPLVVGRLGLGLLATGLLVRHAVIAPAAYTLRESDVLALFPLWELGYALYHLLVVPTGLMWPPDRW